MYHGKWDSFRVMLQPAPNVLSNTSESFGILLGIDDFFLLGFDDGVAIGIWLGIDKRKTIGWLLRLADGLILGTGEGKELGLPMG